MFERPVSGDPSPPSRTASEVKMESKEEKSFSSMRKYNRERSWVMANLVVAASVESKIWAGVNEMVKVEGRRARERIRDGMRDEKSCMAVGVRRGWILEMGFLISCLRVWGSRKTSRETVYIPFWRSVASIAEKQVDSCRITALNHDAAMHSCCTVSRCRTWQLTASSYFYVIDRRIPALAVPHRIGYTCSTLSLWAELEYASTSREKFRYDIWRAYS